LPQVALQYACGNSVVCDTESEAKRLCYELGAVSQAVSLDGMPNFDSFWRILCVDIRQSDSILCVFRLGTIVKRSGEMTGGLGGVEGRAHRWEERKVDALRAKREECQKQVHSLEFLPAWPRRFGLLLNPRCSICL
jgi:structural maintenance of chromosome 1